MVHMDTGHDGVPANIIQNAVASEAKVRAFIRYTCTHRPHSRAEGLGCNMSSTIAIQEARKPSETCQYSQQQCGLKGHEGAHHPSQAQMNFNPLMYALANSG